MKKKALKAKLSQKQAHIQYLGKLYVKKCDEANALKAVILELRYSSPTTRNLTRA